MNDQIWEQKFIELAKASGMNILPQALRDKLVAAFEEHTNTRPTLLQRLVATLTFDSFAQALPQGARETQLVQTRQLFYTCPLGDISLDVTARADTIHVVGQLFSDDIYVPFEITVLRADKIVANTTTSKHNLFRFSTIAGRIDILLENDTKIITVKDVPLELNP